MMIAAVTVHEHLARWSICSRRREKNEAVAAATMPSWRHAGQEGPLAGRQRGPPIVLTQATRGRTTTEEHGEAEDARR